MFAGASATSAGGALYAVYWVFYSRFHVQPHDVGLSTVEMLHRSWPLLVALTAALLLSMVVIGAALTNRDQMFVPLLALWLVVTLVVGGALGGMWSLINQGNRRVQTGKSLLDVELFGVPLLSPRVTPVYALEFHDHPILSKVDTLMYLGEAKGSYVVYDFQSGRTSLLPADKVSKLCTEQIPVKGDCSVTTGPLGGAP